MDFLFINTAERSALMGLPHLQQLTYIIGIRPYMDRKTYIVGIKRRISYQSLSEALYIEPHPGIKSGSPSKQQLRRVIYALERAGLIQVQSIDKTLILKCLLANTDISNSIKADTSPTQGLNTNSNIKKPCQSDSPPHKPKKPDTEKSTKADIPHNSEKNMCVYANFEKFWAIYPEKTGKQGAWEEFKKLQPSDDLLSKIITALNQQIHSSHLQQSQGEWIPKWKFPANWLMQHCWEDEIHIPQPKETKNETHPRPHREQSVIDNFWQSCKTGAKPISGNHVIRGKS